MPINLRRLRACTFCRLIKEGGQFEQDGCENCRTRDVKTSTLFEGCIAMMDPEKSWVATWQGMRQDRLKPGIYAINVIDNEAEEDEYEQDFLADD